MWQIAIIPFVLQALAIFVDETVFHLKRGLPKWERLGHPLDTFTVLVCMAYVLFVPFSKAALMGYVFCALFSSVFVTKDEFIHKEHCKAEEQWLHAILFILHPLVLTSAGLIWPVVQGHNVTPWIGEWLSNTESLRIFLYAQLTLMSFFLFYQIVFWNFLWKNKPVIKQ